MDAEALLKERAKLEQDLDGIQDVVVSPGEQGETRRTRLEERIASIRKRLDKIDQLLSDGPI